MVTLNITPAGQLSLTPEDRAPAPLMFAPTGSYGRFNGLSLCLDDAVVRLQSSALPTELASSK